MVSRAFQGQHQGRTPEPLLEDLAEFPDKAATLSKGEVYILMSKCTVLQSVLLARLVLLAELQSEAPATGDPLLSVVEVSRRLGFRPAYVYELVRKGDLDCVRSGKYVRVPETALTNWRQRHLHKTAQHASRERQP